MSGYDISALAVLVILIGFILFCPRIPKLKEPVVCELSGLKWNKSTFCHNFLITGAIGSGKTVAINNILDQLFTKCPEWGGIVCDNKGNYHQDLLRIAEKHGRKNDVILIEVAYEGRLAYQAQRLNLLRAGGFSSHVMASILADIASQGESKGKHSDFFREQTITHIEAGIKFLEYIEVPVTLHRLKSFLCSEYNMNSAVEKAMAGPGVKSPPIVTHWLTEFMNQPSDQIGGVRSSISNALSPFEPEQVVATFSSDLPDTVDFNEINQQKIICVLCPTSYPKAKSAINQYFKSLLFALGKRRYDMRKFQPEVENLLVLMMDEAQHSTSAQDHRSLDTLRDANCAFVYGIQDQMSLYPVVGEHVANVILSKFRNLLIFSAENFKSAERSADTMGKRKRWKWSYGTSGGRSTSNRSESYEHILTPDYFNRKLPNHYCAIMHTNKKWKKKVKLPLL